MLLLQEDKDKLRIVSMTAGHRERQRGKTKEEEEEMQ